MAQSIEWVQIPAGDFLFGLSEEQVGIVRAKLWYESGLFSADKETRDLISNMIGRYAQGDHSIRSSTELEVLQSDQFSAVLVGESILRQQAQQQAIKLDEFYISRYPVTLDQLDEFLLTSAPHTTKRFYQPHRSEVEKIPGAPAMVDWHLADLFCQWIGARLPTEIEWDKAARGVDGRLYPWGNNWDPHHGNFIADRNAPGRPETPQFGPWTTPVNSYPSGASPFGVWDMAGNLYEWTSTIAVIGGGTEGPTLKSWGVKHAGVSPWFNAIVAFRHPGGYGVDDNYEYTGFRPVRDQWQKRYWHGWSDRAHDGK